MSPSFNAAAQTFQLRSEMAARGPLEASLPKCVIEPSGRRASSVPCFSWPSKAKTARAAAGAEGERKGSDECVSVFMKRRGVGKQAWASAGDERLRRLGLAEERHALDPEAQRLPVDAGDDAERQQGKREERAAQAPSRQRLEDSRHAGLQEHAGRVVMVDPRHGSRSLDTRGGRCRIQAGAHEAEAVLAGDRAERRDMERLGRARLAAEGELRA